MIRRKSLSQFVLACLISLSVLSVQLIAPVYAQKTAKTPATTNAPQPYADALAAIEKAIETKRKEFGIPGASLVIVKDDRIIYMKGLGLKNFVENIPVTPDTLFAIGSASKAFTAMLTLMSADQGKMSLDDSPKKFLPYFKLRDPDADAKVTIRDLLSHRSGLNRTDLAMMTGVLNREELIKVVGMAKPTAKLGEKFQYQNVMYAAAGEAVARAQNSTWDKLISERIFKPLGMSASDTTATAMQKARDFSFGYDYNLTTKVTRRLPQREIEAAAPAGAINSNARDMAKWLRFILSGGVANGKRLVSEHNFNEWISPQIKIGGNVSYGLGWFLREWDKHKVIEHGGTIDGFNAQVAVMPDQKLGFVLLTNVTSSALGAIAMNTIWQNIVGEANKELAVGPQGDPKLEVGKYLLATAGINFDVTMKDDKLILNVPGQPPYPLESLGGRRYKLADPAPPGFYATFRPVKGNETETELFLEQPQGNIVLRKETGPNENSTTSATANNNPLSEYVGSYQAETSKTLIEIGVKDGKVSLIVPGQPPYPLTESEKNKLRSPSLPEAYWIDITRDQNDNVSGIVINQPQGRFAFHRIVTSKLISTDDLIAHMITAYGGEENLRRHTSLLTKVEVDMENQGVQAEGEISTRAPNLFASEIRLKALGKQIGTIDTYFNGSVGGESVSFGPGDVYGGKRLVDIKARADFYDFLNWKKNYETIAVKRVSKVGDEEVFVVERKNEKGTPVTDYISTKSFLVLKRDTLISSETSGVELPQTQRFSDYRMVDGVMIPFKVVSYNAANGEIVMTVRDAKWDVMIPDSVFEQPTKVKK